MAIKMVTDSTSYIPKHLLDEYQISVISLNVTFSTETFREIDLENSTFYTKMSHSPNVPTSSQPAVLEFYQAFERHIQNQDTVVGVFISEGMSGTYSTALLAKAMVLEKYPQGLIEVVDSRSNCMEMGFAVLAGAKAAQAGKSLPEVLDQIHQMMQRSRFLFVPDVLEYLRKGGRIGGAAALLGSLLQIKPILTVIDGKTAILEKVRTKKRAIEEIIRVFLEDVKQKGLGEVFVHHINNEIDARQIVLVIEQTLKCSVSICAIGPVIGLHVGPGTVGIVYHTNI